MFWCRDAPTLKFLCANLRELFNNSTFAGIGISTGHQRKRWVNMLHARWHSLRTLEDTDRRLCRCSEKDLCVCFF